MAGDLSYASDDGTYKGIGIPQAYNPSAWDTYFGLLGPNAAQSIPWMVGMGNHDVEPLTDNGFAGILARFPHLGDNKATIGSGSKVVQSLSYGNVAIIGLDDSDVSALDTVNNGYTGGQQTTWLIEQLTKYRDPHAGVDVIVVFFHHCPYRSGGPCSDGGDRTAWQPILPGTEPVAVSIRSKVEIDMTALGAAHGRAYGYHDRRRGWGRSRDYRGAGLGDYLRQS